MRREKDDKPTVTSSIIIIIMSFNAQVIQHKVQYHIYRAIFNYVMTHACDSAFYHIIIEASEIKDTLSIGYTKYNPGESKLETLL